MKFQKFIAVGMIGLSLIGSMNPVLAANTQGVERQQTVQVDIAKNNVSTNVFEQIKSQMNEVVQTNKKEMSSNNANQVNMALNKLTEQVYEQLAKSDDQMLQRIEDYQKAGLLTMDWNLNTAVGFSSEEAANKYLTEFHESLFGIGTTTPHIIQRYKSYLNRQFEEKFFHDFESSSASYSQWEKICQINYMATLDNAPMVLANNKKFNKLSVFQNQEQIEILKDFTILHEIGHCESIKDGRLNGLPGNSTIENRRMDKLLGATQYSAYNYISLKAQGKEYSQADKDMGGFSYDLIMGENFADVYAINGIKKLYGQNNPNVDYSLGMYLLQRQAGHFHFEYDSHSTHFSYKEALKPENITNVLSSKTPNEFKDKVEAIARVGTAKAINDNPALFEATFSQRAIDNIIIKNAVSYMNRIAEETQDGSYKVDPNGWRTYKSNSLMGEIVAHISEKMEEGGYKNKDLSWNNQELVQDIKSTKQYTRISDMMHKLRDSVLAEKPELLKEAKIAQTNGVMNEYRTYQDTVNLNALNDQALTIEKVFANNEVKIKLPNQIEIASRIQQLQEQAIEQQAQLNNGSRLQMGIN